MNTMDRELFNTYLSHEVPGEMATQGYCILFDMEDSTAMKTRHGDWKHRFVFFYEAFCSLIDRICRKEEIDGEPVLKFLGDAAMAYIPCKEADTKRSVGFLTAVLEFRQFLFDMHDLLGVRVRTVLTYLDHIQLVEIPRGAGSSRDALGQGIDFTFRLEKFGSADTVCLNEMFRASIGQSRDGCLATIEFLPCRRQVKGWPEPQTFWLACPRSSDRTSPPTTVAVSPSAPGRMTKALAPRKFRLLTPSI